MASNLKYINRAGICILTSLVIITTVAMAQQSRGDRGVKAKPDYKEIAKTVINIPEGDTRPLVALAAEVGYAKGVFTGRIVQEMNQKMGSKVNIQVDAKRLERLENGCPVVELTIQDTAHPNIPAEKLQMKACPSNKIR